MADLRQETIDTYNRSAKELAQYFRGIGPRDADIDKAFQQAGNPREARVVEIGCGDGRDARSIARKAAWYLGFDVSEELIKIAQEYVPEAKFLVADAANFKFPPSIDIVFAFASLLHLDKEELKVVLKNVHQGLNSGGVFYVSVKYSPRYKKVIKNDQYGKRLFYLYNEKTLISLAEPYFKLAQSWRKTIGHTDWLELMFVKTS